MTADEIRERFNLPKALLNMAEQTGPVESTQSLAVSSTYLVEAVGEVAAQLAELNQHLALIASVVRPKIDARAARVRVDAKVSEE